ncbi:hypothetical protein QMO56_02285 [Roseomonas sp. E05]|uniref:hypothetical protein n=1 Tax=Roseomonas sp. E05 TaxID=3046310 RepID=UPI0024B9BE09|nr:hypothetical protein [Roseomonas sp. E05]MDJ0386929.1 hypothetical protein [Roseomonas sp. E05]
MTTKQAGMGLLGSLAVGVLGAALLGRGRAAPPVRQRLLDILALPPPVARQVKRLHAPRLGDTPRGPLQRWLGIPPSPAIGRAARVRAARRLNRSAGLLAGSVLLDSALEHYRGSFRNPAMYTPLGVSALSLAASLHGKGDRHSGRHPFRSAIYAAAAVTGILGTGFHLYNIMRRPGGFAWQNLFYGAPLGAPMAISLAGLMGSAAEHVRDDRPGMAPRIFGLPAGRMLAAMSGAGILGTVGEAGLLHFRGAYHNPAMFLPVTMPPAASALLLNTALAPARRNRWITRWWLRLTALLGFAGVGFHAYGVQRNMGGWRNWSQNLLNGPPLPAPPSFTGLALAGLAALDLLEDEPDA